MRRRLYKAKGIGRKANLRVYFKFDIIVYFLFLFTMPCIQLNVTLINFQLQTTYTDINNVT